MKELFSSLDPFPFAAIDDIIPSDLFNEVKEYAYKNLPYTEPGIHQHMMRAHPLISQLKEVYYEICEHYYNDWGLTLTETPDVGSFFQFSCYNTTHMNYKEYHIHNDSPKKITSLVIALSDEGNLTEIYKTPHLDSFAYTADWKPNRGIMFKRSDNSWHKVGNPLGTPRVTVSMIRSYL